MARCPQRLVQCYNSIFHLVAPEPSRAIKSFSASNIRRDDCLRSDSGCHSDIIFLNSMLLEIRSSHQCILSPLTGGTK